MGIRFACPNGHPLHVKAELAGKRGICPECQVRFTIPHADGGSRLEGAPAGQAERAASGVPAAPASVADSDNPAVAHTQPAGDSASATPPQEGATSQQVAWYIRPSAGGQYGPADEQLIRQWTSEGRVAADSYVWRTGWADWRLASDVPEHFPRLAAAPQPAPAPQPADYNGAAEPPTPAPPAESEASLATARYRRRKRQSARGQQLAAVVLILLTVVLAGVLVWVLRRPTDPEPSPPETTPAARAAAGDSRTAAGTVQEQPLMEDETTSNLHQPMHPIRTPLA